MLYVSCPGHERTGSPHLTLEIKYNGLFTLCTRNLWLVHLGLRYFQTYAAVFALQMFNFVLGPALVICAQGSVSNQHLFYADPDLDPGRQSNADPDPDLSITKL